MKDLLKEIDQFLRAVNFDKIDGHKTLCRLEDLYNYRSASDEEKAKMEEFMANHRACTHGIFNYGFKVHYVKETKSIEIDDAHVATMLVKAVHNRPQLILTFNDNVKYVKVRTTYFFRDAERPVAMKIDAARMDDIMYDADVCIDGQIIKFDAPLIKVDPESIDTFYAFNEQKYVRLTPAMRKRYWQNPCTLTRYDVNKSSTSNGWGITYAVWRNNIIEIDGGIYLDDITKEELDELISGYENSGTARTMRHKFAAMNNEDEEDKEQKKALAKQKIAAVQKIIDDNEANILTEMSRLLHCPANPSDDCDTMRQRLVKHELASCGLDCGYLYFQFSDSADNELIQEVSEYGMSGCYSSGKFSLRIPYDNQSTTFKRIEAMIIQRLAKEKGINLSYLTVLD